MLNIEIKERGFFDVLYSEFLYNLSITMFVYVILLIIIYLLLQKMQLKEEQYTRQLEADIQEKTYAIEKQKDTFETLFEKSSDGILIIDDHKFIQCNEKIVKMLLLNYKMLYLCRDSKISLGRLLRSQKVD